MGVGLEEALEPLDASHASHRNVLSAWSRPHGRRQKRAGASATVRIRVQSLTDMFQSLDPSPFADRDLAAVAASFIESEFQDKRAAKIWHLSVEAPGNPTPEELQAAVRTHYLRQAASAKLARREFLRLAHVSLIGGLSIFTSCIALLAVVERFTHPWSGVTQGLTVFASLALWRPAEALLYGWIPYFRRERLCERLARLRVTVKAFSIPAQAGR